MLARAWCSRSEAHLEGVIIELASELVVVLRFGLAGRGSALAEHGWEVGRRGVDLLLAASLSHVAFELLARDESLSIRALLVHHVVGGGEVALLKSVLGSAVAAEQVVREAALLEVHGSVVVLVLFLSLIITKQKR